METGAGWKTLGHNILLVEAVVEVLDLEGLLESVLLSVSCPVCLLLIYAHSLTPETSSSIPECVCARVCVTV